MNRRQGASTLMAQAPDLIEVGDPYRLAWASLDAAEKLGIPVVGFTHSNIVAMARRLAGQGGAWMARRYVARLYRQFDLVLAPSLSMRDQLRDWGIGHVAHQPLGVDSDIFRPEQRDFSWRVTLGLPPQARVLVYAGRFGPEKNLQVLADATRKLGAPYVFVAIGAGPCPPKGPRTLVLPFLNSRTALARALASADVFVHAGDQETFGLAALEGMACGCPVVACGRAGLRELVTDQAGARVDHLTADAFAQAIRHVFAQGRTAQSQAARELALTHRWHVVMGRLLDRYRELLPPLQ